MRTYTEYKSRREFEKAKQRRTMIDIIVCLGVGTIITLLLLKGC